MGAVTVSSAELLDAVPEALLAETLKRGVRRRCRVGFGVARNYWWQGQNAFSEK